MTGAMDDLASYTRPGDKIAFTARRYTILHSALLFQGGKIYENNLILKDGRAD